MSDLFETIDEISSLMYEYDQDFDEFVANSEYTIAAVVSCRDKIQRLMEQHGDTIESLGKITVEVATLSNTYECKAIEIAAVANSAKKASIFTSILGATTSVALLFIPPPLAIRAAQVTATASGIGFGFTQYKATDSKNHAQMATQLGNALDCGGRFKGTLSRVYDELQGSRETLNRLNKENERLTGGATLAAYTRARTRADQITAQCNDIRELASNIFVLRGAVAARIGEINP